MYASGQSNNYPLVLMSCSSSASQVAPTREQWILLHCCCFRSQPPLSLSSPSAVEAPPCCMWFPNICVSVQDTAGVLNLLSMYVIESRKNLASGFGYLGTGVLSYLQSISHGLIEATPYNPITCLKIVQQCNGQIAFSNFHKWLWPTIH